jgi:hypothetical protein
VRGQFVIKRHGQLLWLAADPLVWDGETYQITVRALAA